MSALTALTWNLFHGRDFPDDPSLFTRRSRLFRVTEENGEYAQVNRSLRDEYVSVIAATQWSVCLLQECPPSWKKQLAARTQAEPCRALTSRNQLRPLTGLLARLNPDLVGSLEGGSNLVLVRPPWRIVAGSCRSLLLNPLRERGLRERRRMAFVRIRMARAGESADVCVANLHASTGPRAQTEREVWRAARTAVEWSDGAPLVFGGDLNVRPCEAPGLCQRLERELGLSVPTAPDAIDHLLARGLEIERPPAAWPPESRELEISLPAGMRRLRLSDHAPVEARFRVPLR